MPQALAAMQSGNGVDVADVALADVYAEPARRRRPASSSTPAAGSTTARTRRRPVRIAEQGYLAVIVPMPFNLAVFGSGKASDVMKAHPEITRWAIGGHSLGGAMSAKYVYDNPDAVDGLALWAAYPADNNSLADRNVKVASISATNDGLATPAKIEASRPLLPASTAVAADPGWQSRRFRVLWTSARRRAGDYHARGPAGADRCGDRPNAEGAAMTETQQVIYSMVRVGRVHPPNRQVLRDISLGFYYGAKIGVLGLNGAGKSTLLRIMAGVDEGYLGETMLSKGYTRGLLSRSRSWTRTRPSAR